MSATPVNPLSTPAAWDWTADGYVASTRPLLATFAEAAIAQADLRPATEAIDIATGPGTVACRIAPLVRSVTAIDFSPEMVRHCRERAAAVGLTNVTVDLGDGQALPHAEASFDVAFSMFGLMFFPNRAAGFSEIHRVLRPGGRVFVTTWAPIADSPLMSTLFAAMRAADPARPAPRRDPNSLENPDRVASELTAAGFEDVKVERVFRDVEIPSQELLFDMLMRGSAPIEVLRRALGETEWARQRKVMRAHIAGLALEYPCRLGSTAWLGSGRK